MYNKVRVQSSNIDTVQYVTVQNMVTGIISYNLQITFHHGGTYNYEDVPLDVYNDLISAKSVGKMFNSVIKDTYEFTKLS